MLGSAGWISADESEQATKDYGRDPERVRTIQPQQFTVVRSSAYSASGNCSSQCLGVLPFEAHLYSFHKRAYCAVGIAGVPRELRLDRHAGKKH